MMGVLRGGSPEDDPMRRSRSTQGQVVGVLGEHEAGVATAVLCRQYGVSEQTFYRWKRKYGGLERGEATWLQPLEEENARLMRLVAEKALDNLVLKDFLRKNASRPPSGGQRSRRCGSASRCWSGTRADCWGTGARRCGTTAEAAPTTGRCGSDLPMPTWPPTSTRRL